MTEIICTYCKKEKDKDEYFNHSIRRGLFCDNCVKDLWLDFDDTEKSYYKEALRITQ